MKIRPLIVLILLGLLCGTSRAQAATRVFDFNGTGFDFAFGTWAGNITTGPTAVTIGRLADEFGGAGFGLGGPVDFTGTSVALTAQLGPRNQASEFQVRLQDLASNTAVYVFAASNFTTSLMTTVILPAPTFVLGNVDLSRIILVQVTGNFSFRDRQLEVSIDRLVLTRPPVARCKDVPLDATASSCSFPADINDGSSDPDGDTITLQQTPGAPYGLGSRTVMLTVTDSHGAQSTCTGTVTVRDAIPPPLSCPAPITTECTGASTAVTFATPQPGADNCGMSQSTGCNPASGSGFGVGSTSVSCGATDTRNTASCSFNVNVVDTIAPSISCPGSQTVEATSAAGASVSFSNPTAADTCTTPTVNCDAPSGSTFQ